jgi:hypothetical protein
VKASTLLTKILVRWRIVAAIIGVIKLLLMVLIPPIPPPPGDIFNWAGLASLELAALTSGHFPSIATTGIYGFMGFVLVPFYWLWTQLPIEHPQLETIIVHYNSTPAVLLSFFLNVPTFVADIATGILVSKLVRKLTGSRAKSRLAFLAWYANPFNIFWINVYGGMDIIATSIFMLALLLGGEKKWFRSGVSLSIASILRIFPLLTFPFFLPAIRIRRGRGYAYMLAGFLLTLACGLIVVYATGAGTLTTITRIPERQYWLLDFLGWNLTTQYVKSGLVLVIAQLFIVYRYWRRNALLLHLATASLVALSIGSLAYGGSAHHFLWVSPLLTVCVALDPDQLPIFILTFLTASLSPPIFGLPIFSPLPDTITFAWGAFWAAKATYLVKINLTNIGPR